MLVVLQLLLLLLLFPYTLCTDLFSHQLTINYAFPNLSLSQCNRFGVSGYPAGSLDPELNEDARESLLHFVTTKTSTKRNPDGLLEASAGRLESLDAGELLFVVLCGV